MALDNFIPEVWSARLLANLSAAHVYAQPGVINRDYEGDISAMGDTVRINSIGRVTTAAYTKNTDIAAVSTLSDSQTTLAIDHARYFNFQIDDIDKAQQKPKVMEAAMREASWRLADDVDQFIAALYADVPAANMVGTEASPRTGYTASDVYTYLVDLGTVLDVNNVPTQGRWAVIPPFLHGYLLKDDRFVKSGAVDPTGGIIANGEIGQAAGFRILKSNNVPYTTTTTCYKVLAGHPMAWTYAEQVSEVEAYRPQARFADAVKGLLVYGGKVVEPAALAMLVINTT